MKNTKKMLPLVVLVIVMAVLVVLLAVCLLYTSMKGFEPTLF